MHIYAIYGQNELEEKATVNHKLTVQKERERKVSRTMNNPVPSQSGRYRYL